MHIVKLIIINNNTLTDENITMKNNNKTFNFVQITNYKVIYWSLRSNDKKNFLVITVKRIS